MVIEFVGKTNDENIWVKQATFLLPNGETILISRNITSYVVESGNFDMVWKGCHEIQNGGKHSYKISPQLLENAELVDIELRDDAPSGYYLEVNKWKAS